MGFNEVMRKAFPFISVAASMGGPLGTMAASFVGKAIGIEKPKSDAESIADILAKGIADPETLLKLRQAENDLAVQMAQLGYQNAEELEATAAADRANARNREIQVRDLTPRILAALVVVLVGVGEGWILTHGYPPGVAGELVGRVLGTLDSALMLVLAYYFGSSAGSDRKTELLANGAK